jgi:hypothetical protein
MHPSRPIQIDLSREANLSPKIEGLEARRNDAALAPGNPEPVNCCELAGQGIPPACGTGAEGEGEITRQPSAHRLG